jgi:hypothetical protein
MVSDAPRNIKRRAERAANPDKFLAAERAWIEDNRARYNANHKRWKDANPEKVRARWRKAKYGVTQVEIDAQFAVQNFSCAICRREDPGDEREWAIDHCHEGNYLRGILCHSCNRGLGAFRDRAEVLKSAANYLEVTKR